MERQELFDKIRTFKPDLNGDEIIQFALEETVSNLEGNSGLNKILARLEQLETRQLEQDIVTKKILEEIQQIR
ncbi:MAG: hypothetical protein ACLFP2_02490 [Candidatus Woesearchaeota archaeon]